MKFTGYITCGVIALTFYSILTEAARPLTSEILARIDGIPGLMDGNKIHKAIYTGSVVKDIQQGAFDKKTKRRLPQYRFNGRLFTLKDLAKIEEHSKQDKAR